MCTPRLDTTQKHRRHQTLYNTIQHRNSAPPNTLMSALTNRFHCCCFRDGSFFFASACFEFANYQHSIHLALTKRTQWFIENRAERIAAKKWLFGRWRSWAVEQLMWRTEVAFRLFITFFL